MSMEFLDAIESQWQNLLESGSWSEPMKVALPDSLLIPIFTVNGIFYSGTYSEQSPAPYAPRRATKGEFFQLSLKSLPSGVTDPIAKLKGSYIKSQRRGTYKILDVRGEKSGMLTLVLQWIDPSMDPTHSKTVLLGTPNTIVGAGKTWLGTQDLFT